MSKNSYAIDFIRKVFVNKMNFVYPDDTLQKILTCQPFYESYEQECQCKDLLDSLSIEDQEAAACTSYAYWYSSRKHKDTEPHVRSMMAMKEVRRHFVGEGGNIESSLKSLVATLAFRKEYQVDLLRLCFLTDVQFLSDEERDQCLLMQSWIASELPKQHIVVLGKDNSNRPTVRLSSRQKNDDADNNNFHMDAFILTRIYMVERAAATVEYISQGERDTFNVVFRCDDYDRAFAPPFTAIQSMVKVLQQNYPERLHQFVALDPPFWIRTIYSLLKYLVASDSAKKIFLITKYDIQNDSTGISSSLSDEVLFGHIDPTYYLWNVPFYCPYEEKLSSLEKPM